MTTATHQQQTQSEGVTATAVRKSFGPVAAVRRVDIEVAPGSIVALLGPNGAGKTTVVRIIATLLAPDAGQVRVAGHDVISHPAEARARMGLVAQHVRMDAYLSAVEYLTMIGRLRGLARHQAKDRASELIDHFGLGEIAARQLGTYSGGTQRRLALAAGLVSSPSVLLLDEPTTGIDPPSRLSIWAEVELRRHRGVAILLTTQQLDEADRLADRVIVVDHGEIVAEGTPTELKSRLAFDLVDVRVPASQATAAASTLAATANHGEVITTDTGVIRVRVSSSADALPDLVRSLDHAGIDILGLEVRRPTLDDAFVNLVGRPPLGNGAQTDASSPAKSILAHLHGGHR